MCFFSSLTEHGDPTKSYKTPSEDKENSQQPQNGSWFGWLVTTETPQSNADSNGWFGT